MSVEGPLVLLILVVLWKAPDRTPAMAFGETI